jgi:DNA-binding GntR family transcriptional regulator
MNKPSSLHAQLANQVLEYLATRDLPPNSHVPEPELCERFHVSRTPVRGALKLLCEQGYVAHVPRHRVR